MKVTLAALLFLCMSATVFVGPLAVQRDHESAKAEFSLQLHRRANKHQNGRDIAAAIQPLEEHSSTILNLPTIEADEDWENEVPANTESSFYNPESAPDASNPCSQASGPDDLIAFIQDDLGVIEKGIQLDNQLKDVKEQENNTFSLCLPEYKALPTNRSIARLSGQYSNGSSWKLETRKVKCNVSAKVFVAQENGAVETDHFFKDSVQLPQVIVSDDPERACNCSTPQENPEVTSLVNVIDESRISPSSKKVTESVSHSATLSNIQCKYDLVEVRSTAEHLHGDPETGSVVEPYSSDPAAAERPPRLSDELLNGEPCLDHGGHGDQSFPTATSLSVSLAARTVTAGIVVSDSSLTAEVTGFYLVIVSPKSLQVLWEDGHLQIRVMSCKEWEITERKASFEHLPLFDFWPWYWYWYYHFFDPSAANQSVGTASADQGVSLAVVHLRKGDKVYVEFTRGYFTNQVANEARFSLILLQTS